MNANIELLKIENQRLEKNNCELVAIQQRLSIDELKTHLQDNLKSFQTNIAKLNRKNSIIKAKISRMSSQLKQRKAMGDTVQWVDFEKLQIANSQSSQRLDDTNKELINC